MDNNKNSVDISEVTEEKICARCGKTHISEDNDYCEKCEKEMLTQKVPLVGWMLGAISVVLCIFSFVILYYIASPSILGISAEVAARDNRWEDAYYDYSQMLAEIDEISLEKEGKLFTPDFIRDGYSLNVDYIKSIIKATDPITGLYGVNNIYPDIEPYLADPEIKDYFDMYNNIGTTEYALYYMIQGATDYASAIEVVREVAKEEGIDIVFLCYYAFELSRDFNEPIETQLKILAICDELAKESGKNYNWLYAYDYSQTLQYAGKYDESVKWADVLLNDNKTDFEALSQKIKVLWLSGKKQEAADLIKEFESLYNNTYLHALNITFLRYEGKLDEAAELGETILGSYDASPEIYRQLAMVYLLKGEYDTAYTFAYDAFMLAANYSEYYYDDSWNNNETRNTLYICASLCKLKGEMTSEYVGEVDVIIDSFTDIPLGEKVEGVASGDIPVEELLMKGNYDLI